MGKYDRLREHLTRQRVDELELTFTEIEDVLGSLLPASAFRLHWWANVDNPATASVQTRAWRAAGFKAFPIAGKDCVWFRRNGPVRLEAGEQE